MTAVVPAPRRLLPRRRARDPEVPLPPLSPQLQFWRAVLLLVFFVTFSLLLQVLFLSSFQQRSDQQRHFDSLRAQLAEGTAPLGPVDDGEALAPGTPIAYLEAPAIGLRQVVLEGSSAGVLFEGPGHRRDTVFPGQSGTSVLLGRRAAYNGPFSRLGDLEEGDVIRVTTQQGGFDYEVTGLRRENDPAPPPLARGEGRLLLATADGRPYFPDGVLRIDAELTSTPLGGTAPAYSSASLPPAEQMMASDTTTLWALVLWLQALVLIVIGAVWAWHRWGRAKAWTVFLPLGMVVGLMFAEQAARLLPNML